MAPKGILIDYEWCTGCHSCEMACEVQHDWPIGQNGIVVNEIGPWEISPRKWQYSYVPVFTDQCDLCAERVVKGKLPSCVHHCQAAVMKFGDLDDLIKDLKEKPKQVLFSLD